MKAEELRQRINELCSSVGSLEWSARQLYLLAESITADRRFRGNPTSANFAQIDSTLQTADRLKGWPWMLSKIETHLDFCRGSLDSAKASIEAIPAEFVDDDTKPFVDRFSTQVQMRIEEFRCFFPFAQPIEPTITEGPVSGWRSDPHGDIRLFISMSRKHWLNDLRERALELQSFVFRRFDHTANPRSRPATPVKSRDSALEARDAWLYEQCCKGVLYKTIIGRLKQKPKKWPRISSIPGIKKAANAYAEVQGLAPIPMRKCGRPLSK